MSNIKYPVIVTTRKLNAVDKDINIYYPYIVGNYGAVNQINKAILNLVKDIADEQVRLIRERGIENTKITMDGWYELKNNQRGVLSLVIANYTFPIPSAHGLTIMKSLTCDILTGKIYNLSELFKEGSNYVTVLSDIIKQQIKERNISTIEEFNSIKPDQDYYITDKCIVIYFQVYEITAYVYGFPYFPISVYEIQDIIKEDSPLYEMIG